MMRLAAIVAGCAILGSFAAGPLRAEPVEGLYSVELELQPSAADPRRDAIERGLMRVFTRITGSRYAAFDAQLLQLARTAESDFLSTYTTTRAGSVEVSYVPTAVESALERLGWPVWGRERPTTLLWVAIDNGFGDRAILSDGEATSPYEHSESMAQVVEFMRDEIASVANSRGLVFELPRLDLDDLVAIDFADVWGRYEDVVAAASERYRPDSVVLARVRNSPIGMDVEWAALDASRRPSLVGADFRAGLDWLADQYAEEFGLVGGVRLLTMEVSGIASYADYGRVMGYLETIDAIESFDWPRYESGLLSLSVASRGDADQLRRLFALDNVIVPATSMRGQSAAGSLQFEVGRPPSRP